MSVEETEEPMLPGNKLAKESLRPCPECGENVRGGMVRCWNCGAFMNAKIQEKYQEIQSRPAANPSPAPFGEISEGEAAALPSAPAEEEENDFELTTVSSRAEFQAGSPTSLLRSAPENSPAVAEAAAEVASIPMIEVDDAPAKEKKAEPTPRTLSPDEALLDIAMQDDSESTRRRKKRPTTGGVRTASGGFLIFCPYGCRVEVKEQHRGMSGRCPRCRAPFIVPIDPPDYSVSKAKAAEKGAGGAEQPVSYGRWLQAVHLHAVPPEKLVLKPDSLVKLFSEVDLGFGPEGMVVLTLPKKAGGLFGGGDKKDPREAILQHLKEGKPAAEIPAAEKQFYTVEQLQHLRVVQPVASRAQSMFAGVPVFGTGRIAVQLPIVNDTDPPKYLSFGISEFRKLVETLSEVFGLADFGRDCGIPLQDQFTEHKCTYGGSFKSLNNLEFYKADPTVQLVTVGWKCANTACGLTMSEEGRAKADFGGKGAKGIAKAKCPKCQQKFGDTKLEGLPPAPAAAPATAPVAT